MNELNDNFFFALRTIPRYSAGLLTVRVKCKRVIRRGVQNVLPSILATFPYAMKPCCDRIGKNPWQDIRPEVTYRCDSDKRKPAPHV